jgi:hypothetical protein
LARLPRRGLEQHFNCASRRHSEQAKAKQAAKLAYTRIAQAFLGCWTDGKPNLITSSRAIDGLQHELKTEGKFKLCDDD